MGASAATGYAGRGKSRLRSAAAWPCGFPLCRGRGQKPCPPSPGFGPSPAPYAVGYRVWSKTLAACAARPEHGGTPVKRPIVTVDGNEAASYVAHKLS